MANSIDILRRVKLKCPYTASMKRSYGSNTGKNRRWRSLDIFRLRGAFSLPCQNRSWCPLAHGRRPSGKWRASHGRVDSIENAQAFKIRHSTDGDRIGEILDLALGVGECRPRGEGPDRSDRPTSRS